MNKMLKFVVAAACYALAVTFADAPLYADEGAPVAAVSAADLPSRAPFMSALDKVGLAEHLDKAGINIFGYAQGGWFYDATSPRKGSGRPSSDITTSRVILILTRSA